MSGVDLLVNSVLALITFSLGLTLTRHDFSTILMNPRAMAVGLFSQIVLLPLVAVFILGYCDFDPVYKLGFFIIAICPGGVSSNLVSFMMHGNVALSISMTVVNSILALFTIPLLANLGLNYYLSTSGESITLPFWDTFFAIFLVTVLPAIIGVFLRAVYKEAAKKMQPVLRYLLPLLLFLIFAIKIFADKESGGTKLSSEEFAMMLPAGILLNFGSMLLGYLMGTAMLIRFRNRITIIIEVGLQNTAMALLVAGVLLDNSEMEKPALVYATFSFFSTFILTWCFKYLYFLFRKWQKKSRELKNPTPN
jgi:BASS family bile acid:Na+ symporter